MVNAVERRRKPIEREFEEPLEDVVSGFADMRYSISEVARFINLPLEPFKTWCKEKRIGFVDGRHSRRHGEKPTDHGERVRKGHSRHMKRVRCRGKSRFIRDWADQLGVSYNTVWVRLNRGWRPSDAVSMPAMSKSDAGFKGAMGKWRR